MSVAPGNLGQVLFLVGSLDDAPGEQTARERFRQFLQRDIHEVGQLRDYIEECLRTPGDQYARALQDLVNRLGQFLGFTVTFGRYQGVQGQVGFDGHWVSPTGYHIVAETKTTEVYTIRTDVLVGYVDKLITERAIPDWDSALGLYVVGRPDAKQQQLEQSILAQKRTHQLRVSSVDSLLALGEMMTDYGATHEDILAVLRPSSPRVDAVVDLLKRLVANRPPAESTDTADLLSSPPAPSERAPDTGDVEVAYWLTPVTADDAQTAEEVIQNLVGQEHIYAFGDKTPGRKTLKPGDWICFYATGTGVVAHARVVSRPEKKANRHIHHPDKYPWVFRVQDAVLHMDCPTVIDPALRGQLDAFRGRNPGASWAWFVQGTHRLSRRDFDLLVQR